MTSLVKQGRENLQAIADFVSHHNIDANLTMVGKTAIVLTDHAINTLPAMLELHRRWDEDAELLDRDHMQADVHSKDVPRRFARASRSLQGWDHDLLSVVASVISR